MEVLPTRSWQVRTTGNLKSRLTISTLPNWLRVLYKQVCDPSVLGSCHTLQAGVFVGQSPACLWPPLLPFPKTLSLESGCIHAHTHTSPRTGAHTDTHSPAHPRTPWHTRTQTLRDSETCTETHAVYHRDRHTLTETNSKLLPTFGYARKKRSIHRDLSSCGCIRRIGSRVTLAHARHHFRYNMRRYSSHDARRDVSLLASANSMTCPNINMLAGPSKHDSADLKDHALANTDSQSPRPAQSNASGSGLPHPGEDLGRFQDGNRVAASIATQAWRKISRL